MLGAFSVLGLLLAFVPAYTDRVGLWTLDGETIRWAGTGLFISGRFLRLWPVFVPGRLFSGLVAIQKNHELVTTGPYGVSRHPSYLGLIVNSFGWVMAFRSGIGILIVAALLVPVTAWIRAEERLLAQHFGVACHAHWQKTWMLLPAL